MNPTAVAFAELALRSVLGSSQEPTVTEALPSAPVASETSTSEPKTAPDEFDALFQAGQARHDDGDFAGAAAAWQTLLERLPEEPEWRLRRSSLALMAGEEWRSVALEGNPRESLTRAAKMLDEYLESVQAAYGSAHDDSSEMEDVRALRSDIAARLALLEADEKARPATIEPAPAPAPARPIPAKPKEEPLFTAAAWSLTGVSIAALGLGATFGALSTVRKNSADCEDTKGDTFCTRSGARDARDSRRFAIGSDVSLAIGGVAAVAVIAIVATRAKRRSRARAAAWTPTIGPRAIGFAWSRRF